MTTKIYTAIETCIGPQVYHIPVKLTGKVKRKFVDGELYSEMYECEREEGLFHKRRVTWWVSGKQIRVIKEVEEHVS